MKMSKSTVLGYATKTYSTPFMQTDEELYNLSVLGKTLSVIRNDDYRYFVDCYRDGTKPTKQSRRTRLMQKYSISSREADSIVYANSDQFDLVKRTTNENIADWEKDIRLYRKKFAEEKSPSKRRYIAGEIQSIQSKIEQSRNKYPSCCFGGKKLQKRITQHPEDTKARTDWNNKRLFLSFMGNSHRSMGNDIIKYDCETGCVTTKISEGLRSLCAFPTRSIPLGTATFKRGQDHINRSVSQKQATYYQFVWNSHKQRWYLHTSVRLNEIDQKKNRDEKTQHSPVKTTNRICGIDQNRGFITATIIDEHGNPIAKRTLHHTHSKDINTLVNSLVVWCINSGVGIVAIEKLAGLNHKRRKSNGGSAGMNRVLSTLPFGEFKQRLASTCATYGVEVKEVNPHNTSKNTVQWPEDIFGITTHEKASYLVARRCAGLQIVRRNPVSQHPEGNRVSRRALHENGGSILRNNHDCTSSEVRVVSCGT